jgi:uncharacterized protein
MKLDNEQESSNVEDRRGSSGGGGGRGMGAGKLGLGTVAIALLASWIFGVDPSMILNMAGGMQSNSAPVTQSSASNAPVRQSADEAAEKVFVGKVLSTTEAAWGEIFKAGGSTYRPPKLVLFRGATATACGTGNTASGPFYCPGDQKVYIDLKFYDDLRTRFKAPGDFAQAYVIAHEIGHHVQHLLGTSGKVDAMRGKVSETEHNKLSVRLELQADCYAGIWANYANRTKRVLDPGDIEEALQAATAIGDDTLQKQSRGYVTPDSFTHGSSAQRVKWFKTGMESGNVQSCDTFSSRGI